MRKLISYIAISLDGKIAKADGDIGWLDEVPNPDKTDYGYQSFYESIDTTLMGNTTYKQVLGFGIDFPYAAKKNFVITRDQKLSRDENATYISREIKEFVLSLKKKEGKDIWLVGGGQLNSYMLNEGLLDELRVYVMPVVLGVGIPLFADKTSLTNIALVSSQKFSSGVVELIYTT